MFHERQIYDEINQLHERALKIVYNDTITSFEELLVKPLQYIMKIFNHWQSKCIKLGIIYQKETLAIFCNK